jgi:hypothetical protein
MTKTVASSILKIQADGEWGIAKMKIAKMKYGAHRQNDCAACNARASALRLILLYSVIVASIVAGSCAWAPTAAAQDQKFRPDRVPVPSIATSFPNNADPSCNLLQEDSLSSASNPVGHKRYRMRMVVGKAVP